MRWPICLVWRRERGSVTPCQRRGAPGATVTEFAVLAPLVVLLLLGVLEGGRIFTLWVGMEHEARDSARVGAVAAGDPARAPTLAADVKDRATTRLKTLGMNPANLTVNVAVGAPPTGVVDVDVRYVMDVSSPMIKSLLPAGFTLRARSAMRVE